MKEKGKWTPHIIAAAALVVFIVLGSACASAPKPPIEIVYDTSVPEDQTATLFIPTNIVVLEFNGEGLKPIWGNPRNNTAIKIPAGSHSIRAAQYDPYGYNSPLGNRQSLAVAFNAIAGRTYKLGIYVLSDSSSMSKIEYTYTFMIYEMTQGREPEPDEQLLFIKYDFKQRGGAIIVLDKGTVEERSFCLDWFSSSDEFRVILPKGEHTIDFELPPGPHYKTGFKYAVEPQRHFTASTEPVKYILEGTGKTIYEPKIITLTRK